MQTVAAGSSAFRRGFGDLPDHHATRPKPGITMPAVEHHYRILIQSKVMKKTWIPKVGQLYQAVAIDPTEIVLKWCFR